MPTDHFKSVLQDMDIVGKNDENWSYFREDFDDDENGMITIDKFEEDFKEIGPHIENVVNVVLHMMDAYCKDEYNKRSLKNELMMMQRNNQAVM